jgi:hypothetical protein
VKRRRTARLKPIPAGDPIGLLTDGSINIGTPEQMKPKWDEWQRKQAEIDKYVEELKRARHRD